MPGRKKLAEELFFSLKPTVSLPSVIKNNWFVGKKKVINLPAYRNIYSTTLPTISNV